MYSDLTQIPPVGAEEAKTDLRLSTLKLSSEFIIPLMCSTYSYVTRSILKAHASLLHSRQDEPSPYKDSSWLTRLLALPLYKIAYWDVSEGFTIMHAEITDIAVRLLKLMPSGQVIQGRTVSCWKGEKILRPFVYRREEIYDVCTRLCQILISNQSKNKSHEEKLIESAAAAVCASIMNVYGRSNFIDYLLPHYDLRSNSLAVGYCKKGVYSGGRANFMVAICDKELQYDECISALTKSIIKFRDESAIIECAWSQATVELGMMFEIEM